VIPSLLQKYQCCRYVHCEIVFYPWTLYWTPNTLNKSLYQIFSASNIKRKCAIMNTTETRSTDGNTYWTQWHVQIVLSDNILTPRSSSGNMYVISNLFNENIWKLTIYNKLIFDQVLLLFVLDRAECSVRNLSTIVFVHWIKTY
jgi:hypothetical protein